MIVELFGTPGAGKSTLVREVAAGTSLTLSSDISKAWRSRSKLGRAATAFSASADPRALGVLAAFTLRMPIAGSDSLLRLAALPGKRRRLRHRSGQLLLEEGLLQDLWSILYSARHYDPDPLRLAPLIRYLYRGLDVRLVHIKVDADCARDRIVGRPDGKSRFDAMAEAELRGRLRETAKMAPAIAEAAIAAGLTVETLDGLAPLAVNADRLRAIVQEASAPGGQTA